MASNNCEAGDIQELINNARSHGADPNILLAIEKLAAMLYCHTHIVEVPNPDPENPFKMDIETECPGRI